MSNGAAEPSLLDKLDSFGELKQFDAFPKLPSTYRARSESRGLLTIFVSFVAFLLVLNDIGEFIWGWPDYEFSVDRESSNVMKLNVDMLVNMPCSYLTVDLRDAVGDRLFLSNGFARDGAFFDLGQATALKEHSAMLSARQAIAQSRRSRGFFGAVTQWMGKSDFRPTWDYSKKAAAACRIHGNIEVKKVTANLHVTTLGHGYASNVHVPHNLMNLSHVITEFSFGPYFPDIVQPLDYSFETADEPFIAYQYYLTVVPTTYIAPRQAPLETHQYSVTHYTRKLEHNRGTPGIFFKFDLDPVSLTIHQRTTTFLQFFVRCVGVVGGVWVCVQWAVKVGTRAVEAVSGQDTSQGIVAAEATGVRRKWGGGELRSRRTQSGTWDINAASSPGINQSYSPYSSYAGTPVSGAFANTPPPPMSGGLSPALGSARMNRAVSYAGHGSSGDSVTSPTPYSPNPGHARSPSSNAYFPTTPASNAQYFPPTPAADANGFPRSPAPGQSAFPSSPAPGQGGFPSSPLPNSAGFPSSPGPPRSVPASPFQPSLERRDSSGNKIVIGPDGKAVGLKKNV